MWIAWNLWLAGVVTLQELDEHWTVRDMVLANQILQAKDAAESRYYKRMSKK